jgi:hypothetical protein
MNIGSYLRFGNMLGGAYDANQQDIVNQRQQQQLENLLANSALARQIDSQKFQDYLAATQGAGGFYRSLADNPPPDHNYAPAPVPGQNSAQQPLPPVDTAQASPVPPRNIQSVPLPGAESVPTFGPKQQFGHISTPDQVAAALKAKQMSPNAAASVLLDMARRGVGQTPAAAPPTQPTQQGQDADSPLSPGTYGRMMALIQNNQPINLAARTAADLLKAHPNMSDRELGLTMSMINPTLTKQADAAIRAAGLVDTDFFKTVNALLRQQKNQHDDALLPSQIDKAEAQAHEHNAKARYYSDGDAGATGAAPQAADANSPNPNLSGMQQQVIQSWLGGGKLPVGGPQGVAARREEANLQQQLGLPPGAIPAIGQQAKSSQATATQLQNRYAQFQTSAKTLEKQFDQVQEIAKQLQLNGIATTNKGRLIIDRKLAPTGSAQGQLVAQYDALVNEMAREYGIVTGFGKMTGYAFKSAEKVFDPAQGVAINGVADAVQFGTKQAGNAFQDTLQYYQSLPQSKLIEAAKNKPLAAQYVGFKLMDSKTFADYAKQHFNGDTDAAQRYLIAHRIYPE